MCWRRSFYSFIRFTKETLFRFTLFSCFFTPQRIRLAFAFVSVGEDVSFMIVYPLNRFRLVFSFLCVGVVGGTPPHLQRGGPLRRGLRRRFPQGFPFAWWRRYFYCFNSSNSNSTKAKRLSRAAEKQRSTTAEKHKESKGRGKQSTRKNNKQSKQGRAASENLKREKRSRQSEKQKSRKGEKQEKRKSREAEKQRSRKAEESKSTKVKKTEQ